MTVGPSVVALPAVATAHATARGTDDHAADPIETVAGDAAIDAPARSLSPLQPAYPAAAAAAGIEAVVRVEILIDPTGAVLEARPLDHVGYGLEDAAVRALRSARFTPPRRHGHPVRVRMIWSLAFRLT
jgi:TonB family protein